MVAEKATSETFVAVTAAALALGVPMAWLRAEAVAGRVPCLRAGRRILFDVPAVREALLSRMTEDRREVVANA